MKTNRLNLGEIGLFCSPSEPTMGIVYSGAFVLLIAQAKVITITVARKPRSGKIKSMSQVCY